MSKKNIISVMVCMVSIVSCSLCGMGPDESWLPRNRQVGTSELPAFPSQHSVIIPELTPEARAQKKLQDLAQMIQKQKDQLNPHEEWHGSVVKLCDEFTIQIHALQQQVGGLQTKNDFYENQMQELKQKVNNGLTPCFVVSSVVLCFSAYWCLVWTMATLSGTHNS